MSNRLPIDPTEIVLSDPQAIRRRILANTGVTLCNQTDTSPVVKRVDVDFGSGDGRSTKKGPYPAAEKRGPGRPRIPKPFIAGPEDAIKLYRMAYSSPNAPSRTLIHIVNDIAKLHGISCTDIMGARRHKRITTARQHAFYAVVTERPDLSYPEIARRMGGKDHTTVMYGAAAFARRYGFPPVVRS